MVAAYVAHTDAHTALFSRGRFDLAFRHAQEAHRYISTYAQTAKANELLRYSETWSRMGFKSDAEYEAVVERCDALLGLGGTGSWERKVMYCRAKAHAISGKFNKCISECESLLLLSSCGDQHNDAHALKEWAEWAEWAVAQRGYS